MMNLFLIGESRPRKDRADNRRGGIRQPPSHVRGNRSIRATDAGPRRCRVKLRKAEEEAMRRVLVILAIIIVVVLILMATGILNINQTRNAELPNFSSEGGQLPAFDVDTNGAALEDVADDVGNAVEGAGEAIRNVDAPDVDVKTETKNVEVPDVDVETK